MTTPLHTQAQQLETALRDASRAKGNPAYAALAYQVQAVAERLKEIEPQPVEPEYRMLEEGEIIQEGDECRDLVGSDWYYARYSVGFPMRDSVGFFRRPLIPADEFQTLTEFHQKVVGEEKK